MAEEAAKSNRIQIIRRLICRGWHVLSELHTGHWLIFDVLGFSVLPSTITSAAASLLIGNSRIVVFLVFIVTLIAAFTGISLWRLASIGQQHEQSIGVQTAAAPTLPMRETWWLWLVLGLAIGVSLWAIPNIQLPEHPSAPYEGRPLAIAWASARLAEYSPSTISAFILDAYNPGPDEVTLQNAYILSSIDGTRITMHIINPPSERIPISVAMPVPKGAYLSFEASFDAGISETEFSTRWHDFIVVLEFNHSRVRRDFNRLWVLNQISQNNPGSRPHVSRRQQ